MEERREYGRKPLRFKVILTAPEGPYRSVTAEAANLSVGGVGLKLKEAVKSRGRLFLRITRPFFQDSIEGTGEIMWQKFSEGSGEFLAGVRFIEMPFTKIKALLV